MVHVFPKYRTDWSNMENRNTSKLGDMSYEEWKNKHKERLEKKQNKVASTKTETSKSKEQQGAEMLRNIYANHSIENNLRTVPADEMEIEYFKADYGKMNERSIQVFNETLSDLSSKYDSTLSEIRVISKEEWLAKRNDFAFTYHNYETDESTLVINPAKFKDHDAYVTRIKELVGNKYATQIEEKYAEKYIATHEFAHTLVDMQTPLNNKRNWVEADYDKVKAVRKEVEKVYADYLKEKEAIEKEFKKYELDFLNNFSQESADKARKYKEQLDAMTISKYGNVNSDEFMAECFTHAQLGGKQNDYVDRIMDIIEKHFGR